MALPRLAILDLYNGIPNQGMRCIREIVVRFADRLEYEVFDVRGTSEVPDIADFDLFISSGGPGDPRDGDGVWDKNWADWFDAVVAHNRTAKRKKYIFFICHSFQMAVAHSGFATVTDRRSISFGTFPVHKDGAGLSDPLFEDLDNPFSAADFRYYQVIEPNDDKLAEVGAEVLALEKRRPTVDLERAVMAIRWSPEIVGVQFHPEADAEGMQRQFGRPDIKADIIATHGRDKWLGIMADLSDPDKIAATHDIVIPGFIDRALTALAETPAQAVAPTVGR